MNADSKLSVSVIMPVRNGEAYIEDALRSIAAQSVEVHEILVVDDGSTDHTSDIVRHHLDDGAPIKLLKGPGSGPGPARNVGLGSASGDIIAFLDCDDVWPRGKLEIQLNRMQAEPAVDIVSGLVMYFKDELDDNLEPSPDSIMEEMFHVHLGATIYRQSVFEQVGFFDDSFLYAEDVDLMLKVREADIPMTILSRITLYYRRHDSSMTSVYSAEEKRDFNRAILNSLVRRRKAKRIGGLPPFKDLMEC